MGKLSKRALGFIRLLLAMEPADRPSAQDCLTNIYFENLDKKFNMYINNSGPPVKEKGHSDNSNSNSNTPQVPAIHSNSNSNMNGNSNSSNAVANAEPPPTHWPQIMVPSNSGNGNKPSKTSSMDKASLPQPADFPIAEMKMKYKAHSKVRVASLMSLIVSLP